MTDLPDRRVVLVGTKVRDKPVDFGGEVAAYSFLPHPRSEKPMFGPSWTVPETVANLARQGFATEVILTSGEVIEVRRHHA